MLLCPPSIFVCFLPLQVFLIISHQTKMEGGQSGTYLRQTIGFVGSYSTADEEHSIFVRKLHYCIYIFCFISTSYDAHLRTRQHKSSVLGKCRSVTLWLCRINQFRRLHSISAGQCFYDDIQFILRVKARTAPCHLAYNSLHWLWYFFWNTYIINWVLDTNLNLLQLFHISFFSIYL